MSASMLIPALRRALRTGAVLVVSLVLACSDTRNDRGSSGSFTAAELVNDWNIHHVSPPFPPLLRHADVEASLQTLSLAHPDVFRQEEIGRSIEGRAIHHMWFGRGPVPVLLWSQMHGDEPTATAALFDIFDWFLRKRQEPAVQHILKALTIHAVPMLNPDGAERFQRRNAQGIDINRDALLLQTPEGRALKALRDRLKPAVGFNLHNQSWRTSAGDTGRPASISLLAVAYDEARSENEGRRLTKRLCSIIRDALEPFAPGQMARYDDAFEVRAFGDNLTKWGTSVVLIETGPWPAAEPDAPLTRLNFVAIVTALDALATGRAFSADPKRYESLPVNDSNLVYLLIKNATIVTGRDIPSFRGDVGIVASRVVREHDGQRQLVLVTRVEDVGDLRVFAALETIDASGLTVTPAFSGNVNVGDALKLPEWRTQDQKQVIAPGQPANLLLLRPSGRADEFIVVRHLESERVVGNAAAPAR